MSKLLSLATKFSFKIAEVKGPDELEDFEYYDKDGDIAVKETSTADLDKIKTQALYSLASMLNAQKSLFNLAQSLPHKFDPPNCPIKEKSSCWKTSLMLVGLGMYEWHCPFCNEQHST